MKNIQVNNQTVVEQGMQHSEWPRIHYALIVLGVLWVIGILYVEFFYYYTRRLRMLDPKIKERMLPFTNEPEKWNKIVFYFFSVLIIPRLISFLAASLTCAIAMRILLIGASGQEPISGWRKTASKFVGRWMARLALLSQSFLWISHKDETDLDYSEWLGADYKSYKSTQKPPIIIANHQGWSDILAVMTTKEFPAFISGSFVRDYPLYGAIAQAIGSLFVEREVAASRTQVLGAIRQRVQNINTNPAYPQLCIFPEGCTTNGKALLRFKRGAFDSLNPLQPMYIEYQSPFCNPSYDCLPTVWHVLLMGCQPFIRIIIHRLPTIYPTEYMYKNFAKWGNTNTEIYSEVARDIYCKTFGLGKATLSLADKHKLEEYLYDFSKMKFD